MKKDLEILKELIEKGMIYKKQKIYYSNIQRENAGNSGSKEPTFLELYEPYKSIMTETAFAKILKIKASTFSEKRNLTSSKRMIINIFNEENLTDEEREECIEFLKAKYALGLSHNQRGEEYIIVNFKEIMHKILSIKGYFFIRCMKNYL